MSDIGRYRQIVENINGDKENILSYDHNTGLYAIQAINTSRSVSLGEVDGLISVEDSSFTALLDKFALAVDNYNRSK